MDFPSTAPGSLSPHKMRPPMELKNPTPKRIKGPRFISPLPVCQDFTDSIYSNDYEWPLFTGKFNGNSIIIDDQDEVISLSNKGFFGKGSLSRGTPRVCKRKLATKLVTQSQWKRRQMWSESLSTMLQNHLPESDGSDNSKISHSANLKRESPPPTHDAENIVDQSSENEINGTQNIECSMADNNSLSHTEKNELSDFKENSKLVVTENIRLEESNKIDENSSMSGYEISDSLSVKKASETEMTPLAMTEESFVNKDTKLLDDDEVLVINDLGINMDEPLANLNPRIEKENIKTVVEVLYLSFEEAFFLSYALNCLQVIDLTQNYLSNKALWKLFHETQSDFIEKYVAYHHFRSKGWVVKSGLKFGGDFLLYKKGPAYYHASYIVLVKLLNADGSLASESKSLTWGEILTFNRMSETATKEVLICEVMKPDLPEQDFLDPVVLKEFKVGELLLRKWHPFNENDENDSSTQSLDMQPTYQC